ncbi:hypothetical protein L1887_14830 [Cichorium endivia]|nr:hypothetical protein L1887_14830 [Cichorium endivia]
MVVPARWWFRREDQTKAADNIVVIDTQKKHIRKLEILVSAVAKSQSLACTSISLRHKQNPPLKTNAVKHKQHPLLSLNPNLSRN